MTQEQAVRRWTHRAAFLAVVLGRRFAISLKANWVLGLVALGLSVLMWTLISTEQNPPRTDVFGEDIPVAAVNVPKGLDVFGEISPVRVRVTAPGDMWSGLRAGQFKASVDLAEVGAGEQDVSVRVESSDARIKVVDVIPGRVLVRLEALKEQQVPVRVNIQELPPFGYGYSAPKPSVEQATVKGPESLVNQVDVAVAEVNLGGIRADFSQSVKLIPRTNRGYEVKGVSLTPDAVVVNVSVKQQVHLQPIPVSPRLKGEVAPGYWISGISVDPPTVVLGGPLETLQNVLYVETQPIDVSQETKDFSRTVAIEPPTGTTLINPKTVTVYVRVVALTGTLTLQVTPKVQGLSFGYQVTTSPSSVAVTVSGELPLLRNLQPEAITVTLDASNLRTGMHTLEPKVSVRPEFKVVAVDPKQVIVILR